MAPCKTCGSDGGPSGVALPLTGAPSTCGTCSQPTASCNCEAFCEEDHIQRITYKRYGFTLRVKPSFVWPAPEESVTLQVEGVDRLSPGSILWNSNAGYLHVISFDFTNQLIVAKNEGETCNIYTGGETLPECTDFVVGPPTCVTGSTPIPNIPYLAADFISTAVGDCAFASVTGIIGLTLNDIVSVNGYEYRIADILDASTIQLCNDGDGAPAGTVIPWDVDNDNVPNIPILVTASENPCTRDGINAGVILACDGADVAKPLVGSVGGQIPVWNVVTSRFELKNLAADFAICTSLTADLVVDPLHVGSYLILVQSTANFTVLGGVVIGGFSYVVNVIDDATTAHITPFNTPVAVAVYPVGSSVCIAVSEEPTTSSESADSGPTAGAGVITTAPITFTIVNTSLVHPMHVIVTYQVIAQIAYTVVTSPPGAYPTPMDIEESINGGAYASILMGGFYTTMSGHLIGTTYTYTGNSVRTHIIPAGATLVLAGRGKVGPSGGSPTHDPTSFVQLFMSQLSTAV